MLGALDAFTDGVEHRIDLAAVNGRTFVNNASLGLYAEVVQSPGYRDAKLKTAASILPLGLQPEWCGRPWASPAVPVPVWPVLVSVMSGLLGFRPDRAGRRCLEAVPDLELLELATGRAGSSPNTSSEGEALYRCGRLIVMIAVGPPASYRMSS